MSYYADHKGIHNAGEQVLSRPSGIPDDLWRQHSRSVCLALCATAGVTYTGRHEHKPFNSIKAQPLTYMVRG